MKNVAALLLSAGAGRRLGGHPKALLVLNNCSLLEHGIRRIKPYVDEVVAAVGPNEFREIQPEFDDLSSSCPVRIIQGGATRQESLLNLLRSTSAEWVLIHEIARPLTPPPLFAKAIDAARIHGAAVVFQRHAERDSVGLANEHSLQSCVPRTKLVILQTPHVYRREQILAAHERAIAEGWNEEGTAPLALRAHIPIHLVECKEENLKITYPSDWLKVRRAVSTEHDRQPEQC